MGAKCSKQWNLSILSIYPFNQSRSHDNKKAINNPSLSFTYFFFIRVYYIVFYTFHLFYSLLQVVLIIKQKTDTWSLPSRPSSDKTDHSGVFSPGVCSFFLPSTDRFSVWKRYPASLIILVIAAHNTTTDSANFPPVVSEKISFLLQLPCHGWADSWYLLNCSSISDQLQVTSLVALGSFFNCARNLRGFRAIDALFKRFLSSASNGPHSKQAQWSIWKNKQASCQWAFDQWSLDIYL